MRFESLVSRLLDSLAPATRVALTMRPAHDAPRRILIHDQLVALLRRGISEARWKGEMPPEALLCREFQVSRMTLRKALAALAAERWIALGGRGHHHRIRKRPAQRAAARGKVIRMLLPFKPEAWNSSMRDLFEAFAERVASAGYRVEAEYNARVFERSEPSRLEALTNLPDTAAWVIWYATPAMQRWFAKRLQPTLVLGRVADGVTLPSVFLDTPAVARHAAGLLYARGHREMVYLIASVTSLGDRACAESFVAEARRLGAKARAVQYEMNPASIGARMGELLASRPPPTAFFVGANEVAIAALCHLLAAGVSVPADASVLSGMEDYHLGLAYPSIAHYRMRGTSMGRKAAELLLGLIRHGTAKARSIPMLPEFVEGGSLGPARTS